MIPVQPKPEPADFDQRVRQPGREFLAITPNPTNQEWRDLWKGALDQLFTNYSRTCAYCASPVRKGGANSALRDRSLDHYVAKATNPALAYEWSNYRLSRSRLNARKGNFADVLDPFTVAANWFSMDFLTFQLMADTSLSLDEQAQIQATIYRLQLNSDNDYVKERARVIREYCLGRATFNQIQRHYPFIASEMQRQDFDNAFLPQMQARFQSGFP